LAVKRSTEAGGIYQLTHPKNRKRKAMNFLATQGILMLFIQMFKKLTVMRGAFQLTACCLRFARKANESSKTPWRIIENVERLENIPEITLMEPIQKFQVLA